MNKMKPRTILTTDLECDDMNSLIHLCLFLNEIDLDGVVYTSSQYHFNGDGVHTLGEVTPNYRCQGEMAYLTHIGYPHPDPDAKYLKSYRPFEMGWIESLWKNEYAKAYPNLVKHDPSFPSPERLLSITKYGNCAFEGDVREETEGSKLIKEAILDKDERILYLQSWGGVNTIVRALMSIAEEYKNTDRWEEICGLVCRKVRIMGLFNGVGQDNSFNDNNMKDLYPDLITLHTDFGYGGFMAPFTEQADCIEMFRSEWMKENIKFGHGELMSKYGLFGDGTHYEGEPDVYQYGTQLTLNWGFDRMPDFKFNQYDHLGEGDSGTYVFLFNVGLRGLENGNYGTLLGRVFENGKRPEKGYNYFTGTEGNPNRFVRGYQEEFAARAEWCVKPYEECNHAPIVSVKNGDVTAAPGEAVQLEGSASDPDGDQLSSFWYVYREGSKYSGVAGDLRAWEPLRLCTRFTVPADAKPGDYFNLILEVQDDAKKPITRYAQVIVHVKEAENGKNPDAPIKHNFFETLMGAME